MAVVKVVLNSSVLFVALFLAVIILDSQKCIMNLSNDANTVYVSIGLDIKHFPSRKSGLSRTYSKASRVAPSLKCAIAMKLGNVSIRAASLVLLSGDAMSNPGPVSDPCFVCYKGCRKNQKAIQCDSCDGWFHAKCIGMDSVEYTELDDDSKRWDCMKCLFPQCISLTIGSENSLNVGNKNLSSVIDSVGKKTGLNKRGMKFAHVNIVTLPGHSADMHILLEETNLDVFAVTESRLDATFPDNTVCPPNYVCYREDRNRSGGGCVIFVKISGQANVEKI